MTPCYSSNADPIDTLGSFIKGPNNRMLAGRKRSGNTALMEIVRKELIRQNPKTNIIRIDHDTILTNNLISDERLLSFIKNNLKKISENNVLIYDILELPDWETTLNPLLDDAEYVMHVYYVIELCHQMPACKKYI
ncbi:MAG: hypothetical protein RBR05_00440 [Candidatus Methanomethylophilaceae archaeon]|nr:hypothetical protein [Candidatus Methanomethylophilaceae archaeon]MDY0223855.1 hypothetical protein [Candidatus Methanomethylophilaceae archaeon]